MTHDYKIKPKIIEKGWGREIIIANEPCRKESRGFTGENCGFSGKILHFDKAGSKSSMHFHVDKTEYFYINKGSFSLTTIDPITAKEQKDTLVEGVCIFLSRGTVHQIAALEDNSEIIEIATHDKVYDSVRIRPGDSQKKN